MTAGDSTDGVRTGLAGSIANQMAKHYKAIFPPNSPAAIGINVLSQGIVDGISGGSNTIQIIPGTTPGTLVDGLMWIETVAGKPYFKVYINGTAYYMSVSLTPPY